jgi:hypothetical protein
MPEAGLGRAWVLPCVHLMRQLAAHLANAERINVEGRVFASCAASDNLSAEDSNVSPFIVVSKRGAGAIEWDGLRRRGNGQIRLNTIGGEGATVAPGTQTDQNVRQTARAESPAPESHCHDITSRCASRPTRAGLTARAIPSSRAGEHVLCPRVSSRMRRARTHRSEDSPGTDTSCCPTVTPPARPSPTPGSAIRTLPWVMAWRSSAASIPGATCKVTAPFSGFRTANLAGLCRCFQTPRSPLTGQTERANRRTACHYVEWLRCAHSQGEQASTEAARSGTSYLAANYSGART